MTDHVRFRRAAFSPLALLAVFAGQRPFARRPVALAP